MILNKRITSAVVALALTCVAAGARNVTLTAAGTLKDAGIDPAETELTISGPINAADFSYIFDNLGKLQTLNLAKSTITAYSGAPLPYVGVTTSPAATLPPYCLAGMTNLTGVTLPEGLKAIGKGALSGSGIISLKVPASVTTIGDYALMRCPKLQIVRMESGVTSIGTRAFAYCPALTTVELSSNLSEIPEGLFEACGGLHSLDLATLARCTEIGPWALAECQGVSTLVLPESAEVLAKGALYGTSSVNTLVLPAGIAEIRDGAMGAMESLTTLRADNVTSVPRLGENVWTRVEQPEVTLVAPDAQVNDYRDADQWRDFNVIKKSDWQSSTQNIAASVGKTTVAIALDGSQMTVSAGNKRLGDTSVFNAAGSRIATVRADHSATFNVSGWGKGVYLIVTEVGMAKVAL